ncbi:hypothetical protein ACJMK2_028250 [Sinanodonta woodiana]|uniref:BTB domain-containing protein n=1 Tax=Sinanodonta woodiana TaxID=1069815 RepID=A0ABD3XA39_SINWO
MSSYQDIQSDTSKSDESVSDDPDLKEFDFTIKSAWTDLELEVEGKTLYVTRSSLAIISPVFRRMFKSEFKEKEAIRINLPGKKYEDVLTFLRCSIPWSSVKVTNENILQILPLAQEYQIAGLLTDCCNCLMQQLSSNCNAVKCCEICLLAYKYNLQNVIEKCIVRFWNISSAQCRDLELFNTIPLDIRYRALYARLQAIDSETSESDENVNDDPDLKEFDFTIKSAWSDLELEVEGKTLYVTRGFLDMISPVFRRMFKSEFKEKEAKSISLPDKKYEDVLTFLRCTIPWASVKVTNENILQILPLAHEYQIAGLLTDCCNCLMQQLSWNCNAVKCCDICLLAYKYDLQNVITECIERFWNIPSAQYRDLKLFSTIPLDIRYRVLYARLKAIDTKLR